MLTAPPAVPRPLMTEDGPSRISICSVKKFSRMLTAGSRMPSTNTSLRASKPRMKKRSPKALPPSPVPMVTPGVVRPTSFRLVASLSRNTSCVSTVTLRGVLAIGSLNLPNSRRFALYGAAGSAYGSCCANCFFASASACCLARAAAAPRSLAARRKALRTRICSVDGLAAGGFGRAIGASTVTGGSGCSCASAPVMAATAIKQPTVTFCV